MHFEALSYSGEPSTLDGLFPGRYAYSKFSFEIIRLLGGTTQFIVPSHYKRGFRHFSIYLWREPYFGSRNALPKFYLICDTSRFTQKVTLKTLVGRFQRKHYSEGLFCQFRTSPRPWEIRITLYHRGNGQFYKT